MISKIRTALATVGGLQFLAAVAAIGWGMSKLEQLAAERQAMLEAQAAMLAENEAALLASMERHPSNGPAAEPEVVAFPAADADPLGRGEPA